MPNECLTNALRIHYQNPKSGSLGGRNVSDDKQRQRPHDSDRGAMSETQRLSDSERMGKADQMLITEDWLKSVGFKWDQFERQPTKNWTLWLGGCQECHRQNNWTGPEDFGITLAF